jgi:hypothetical protein
MTKKFKIIYYLLVALLVGIFSYNIYQLVDIILEKPDPQISYLVEDD